MTKQMILHPRVACQPVTQGPLKHFFGYHDKSPWNSTQTHILAHESGAPHRMPLRGEKVTIGVVDLATNQFEPITETVAWNWQQGAMASWVDHPNQHAFVYNDLRDNQYVTVRRQVGSNKEEIFGQSIYTASRKGNIGIGIDFNRISTLRPGYGYTVVKGMPFTPENEDGIYQIDFATGHVKLILSYQQIFDFAQKEVASYENQWVAHLLLNPSGTRFLFLHRMRLETRVYTRLLTANVDGSNMRVLLQGMASHFCWQDDHNILIWARQQSLSQQKGLYRLLKQSFIHKIWHSVVRQSAAGEWARSNILQDSFVLINDQTGKSTRFAEGVVQDDTHPFVSPNGRWVVMDTYPNAENYQGLWLINMETKEKIVLGEFYIPPHITGGYRCDLHSRWSPDGRFVCIDSAHTGTRQMYILDVSQVAL